MDGTPAATARELTRLIPRVMQEMRCCMRSACGDGLSVPQFRALAFVDRQPGCSLTAVAAHVGLGAPAMSMIVNGLVRRALLTRRLADRDRRRMMLHLTADGRALLEQARAATRARFAERLSTLPPAQVAEVQAAIRLLSGLFPEDPPAPVRSLPP
jgi:DNA-binding MarR family transcriptional regulator